MLTTYIINDEKNVETIRYLQEATKSSDVSFKLENMCYKGFFYEDGYAIIDEKSFQRNGSGTEVSIDYISRIDESVAESKDFPNFYKNISHFIPYKFHGENSYQIPIVTIIVEESIEIPEEALPGLIYKESVKIN